MKADPPLIPWVGRLLSFQERIFQELSMIKNSLLLLLCGLWLLSACGENPDPAESSNSNPSTTYNPAVHTLANIALDGADTLALKEKTETAGQAVRSLKQGVSERCDELGRIDGAIYSKLKTQGQGGSIAPCFKNIQFWNSETIYGQYNSSFKDSTGAVGFTEDIWFITDPAGKVHHLPNAPEKGRGFKNEKRIRQYKGKPVYFSHNGFLTSFDLETDEEKIIINTRIDLTPVVFFTKNNGDHIVYKDKAGGKIRRPDGSVESIPEINDSWIYYKNLSNDLTYSRGSYLKNMILDSTSGSIHIWTKALSVTPVALQDWYDNPVIGQPAPLWSLSAYGISNGICEKTNNLIICENRGLILADTSQDVKEIDWTKYETNIGIGGSCVTPNFIYVAGLDKITRINIDLTQFEHVLTNFQTYTLKCLDDNNLIIHGFNTANDEYETFQLLNNVRTMITGNISAFIRY